MNSSPAAHPLSLSMIVRDESKFLDGCLRSVRGIASEIIVVDTGSADDTAEIAAGHGAKVFHSRWCDDFSASRNESLRHCTGEWVLVMDADERLAPGQEGRLERCLEDREAAAHTLLVRSVSTLPTGPSVVVMPYARLFRRDPRIRFEGTIHEQISPAIERVGGKTARSSLVIEHLGYGLGVAGLQRKTERNLRLLHEQLRKNPHDAYAAFQIGNAASMFQRYDEANVYLRRALALGGLGKPLQALVWNLLAEAELRKGSPAGAEACCRASLGFAPTQVTARWYLVGAYIARKDYAAAVRAIREILGMFFEIPDPPATGLPVDLQLDEGNVRQIMGQCLWKMGDTFAAVKCFARALQLNPADPGIQANFATAMRATGAGALAGTSAGEKRTPLSGHDLADPA